MGLQQIVLFIKGLHLKSLVFYVAVPFNQIVIAVYRRLFMPNRFENSEYDQEISQSQTANKPMAPRGKASQQSRYIQEDKQSKAISSLILIDMIAKLILDTK